MTGLKEHPLRRELADEAHARPYMLVSPPVRVSHLAAITGETGFEADHAHLEDLCGRFKVPAPAIEATHFTADLGPVLVKWERHTEFVSFTFFVDGAFSDPFETSALAAVPKDWLAAIPGDIMVATHLAAEAADAPERSKDEIMEMFGGGAITGSQLLAGGARAWTDHRIHDDGFGRILVRADSVGQRRLGRIIQRLLEIETYRYLAMMAFPLAKQTIPQLAAAEHELSEIVTRLADDSGADDERALLKNLSALAARSEATMVSNAYRFSASRAYFDLVERRVVELREERLDNLQPFGEFIYRRLGPAMATRDSVTDRQASLSEGVARASNLLRTRVDVALEEQNRDLLRSMDRRARLQLRLQETVEGLSVAAISYYVLSLVVYMARGLKSLHLPVDPYLTALVALPFVVLGVWGGVRRMRKRLVKRDDSP